MSNDLPDWIVASTKNTQLTASTTQISAGSFVNRDGGVAPNGLILGWILSGVLEGGTAAGATGYLNWQLIDQHGHISNLAQHPVVSGVPTVVSVILASPWTPPSFVVGDLWQIRVLLTAYTGTQSADVSDVLFYA